MINGLLSMIVALLVVPNGGGGGKVDPRLNIETTISKQLFFSLKF